MHPISQISSHNTEPLSELGGFMGKKVTPTGAKVGETRRRRQTYITEGRSDNPSEQFESFEWDVARQRRRLPLRAFDPIEVTTPTFVPDRVLVVPLRIQLSGPTWPIGIPPRLMSPIHTVKFADVLLRREVLRRLSQQSTSIETPAPTPTPMPMPTQRVTHPILALSSTEAGTRASTEENGHASTDENVPTSTEAQADAAVASLPTARRIVVQSPTIFPLGNPFWILLNRYDPRHDRGQLPTTKPPK